MGLFVDRGGISVRPSRPESQETARFRVLFGGPNKNLTRRRYQKQRNYIGGCRSIGCTLGALLGEWGALFLGEKIISEARTLNPKTSFLLRFSHETANRGPGWKSIQEGSAFLVVELNKVTHYVYSS